MKKILAVVVLASLLFGIGEAFAHGGRTDRYGCHYDRKTGVYHCH